MKRTPSPHLHPKWIDSHAYGIVKALQKEGFKTYLVGGCVRDLLLGIHPKDFDIATLAKPNEVRRIVYRAYVIGKRFRLVLVRREEQQYEVATFRREITEDELEDDLPDGDNLFGTPEEDAQRRDFTINALFYDPIHNELIDYAGGLEDLKQNTLRMIGDPEVRLIEDPIRILRGIRLAHKLRLSIDLELRLAIAKHAPSLEASALPRRREEMLKILKLPEPFKILCEMYDLNVLETVSPVLHQIFSDEKSLDQFSHYMNSFHHPFLNTSDSAELFGALVFAATQAVFDDSASIEQNRKINLETHPVIGQLMKDELGMFKSEMSLVTRAYHLQSLLIKKDHFERKGERRRLALVGNEAFPMSLAFCERDHLLSPRDLTFWRSQSNEFEAKVGARKPSVPKRKRKRRKGPPRPSASSSSSSQADEPK